MVIMLRNTAERASRTRAADPGGHGVEVGWESQIRAQRATTKKRRRYGLCPSLTKRVIHGRRRSLQVAVDLTPFVGGTPPAGNVERDIVDITA